MERIKLKSYYGVYFKKNWLDRTFRFYINGDYGSFFSSYLKELSFGNWCFIDIGANQGLYSIIASQNQNIRKIISIEPILLNYNFLINNLKLNGVNFKNVVPLNIAIGNKNESSEIQVVKNHSGASSLIENKSTDENISKEIIEIVKPEKISKYIDNDLKIIIKIDTEGYEQIILNEIYKTDF